MNMYRIFLSFLFFVFVIETASAQYTREDNNNKPDSTEEKSLGNFASRVTFGGGLFARFGDITAVSLAPRIGYLFTKRLNAGISIEYTHYANKFFPEDDYNFLSYGPFATYDILRDKGSIPDIYIGAEFNNVHLNYHDLNLNRYSVTFPMLYVGGGIRYNLGGRVYVFAELMYDILENRYFVQQSLPLNIGIIVR